MKHVISILGAALIFTGVNPVVCAKPLQNFLPQAQTKDLGQDAATKLHNGDFKGAIEAYNAALKLNANDIDAYIGRGTARFELNDKQGAIDDFTQALELNPNNADVYRKRAGVYLTLGRKKQARQDFQRAINVERGRNSSQ